MIHAALPWDGPEDEHNYTGNNTCRFPDCGRVITDGAHFCHEHHWAFRRFFANITKAAQTARPAGISPEVHAAWVRDFR